MKKSLNGILVVEGKEDASYLSNYIASEIVVVNGFELDESLLLYLKDKQVIALTDPDDAGQERLNENLNNVINVEVDIFKCTRGKKNGIAECEISEILATLSPYFVQNNAKSTSITTFDLYNLNISNNSELRRYVCDKLRLGNCNNKQLLKRLNNNNIELKELKKIIEQYQNGN